ncbi:MAG: NfeD family protein [Gammaproteobacteria bacterium]|nr:NfeD family protein [Gammaproteobacteria bacterium]
MKTDGMNLTRRIVRLALAALFTGAGLALLLAGPLLAQDGQDDQSGPGTAVVLEVDGAIGPATNDFIVRGIEDAEESGAALVILRLNTPGGLDTSMRDIIRKILASRVPVATYVSPPGSRAASAGTYIMYASHVAAMAPATNLGSATPVSMSPGGLGGGEEQDESDSGKDDEQSAADRTDGEGEQDGDANGDPGGQDEPESGESNRDGPQPGSAMERKVINDAVAYIKGLARLRDRNEEWAEEAVRSAVNLTAEDALERNVIDIVARDIEDLLAQMDGRTVTVDDHELVLATADLAVETVEPDWRTRLLSVITNPNVAYVLMLAGIYGLFFELSNPGALFPGVLGAICLVLALYAFQVLPVNYAGLALILLGVIFMVAEAFMPSFGVMGIGGAIAFVFGSLILIETDVEAYQISIPLIATVTIVTGLFVFTLISLALRQRTRPVVSGREQMVGDVGEALADFSDGAGTVHIHGEQWSARAEAPVRRGQAVKVRELDGLILVVEPLEEQI